MSNPNSKTPKEIRDSWETPQWLFNWLDSMFNFNIDLAASEDNSKCFSFFSKDHSSAFLSNWNRLAGLNTGFCNPPYSNINPWVDKAIEEMQRCGFTTVMLIPTLSGVKRDKKIIDNASMIYFFDGRISFINAETGKAQGGNDKGSMVVVFAGYGNDSRGCKIECVSRDGLIKEWS